MSLTINSSNLSTISGLFSSMSKNSTASPTGLESILADYKSLNTGTYGKLIKAYYDKVDTSETGVKSKDKAGEKTSSLNETKNDATDLLDSTSALLEKNSKSLWKQSEVTNDDGTTSMEYDKDKIYSAISDYIKDYNSLVDSGQKSSNTGILTQVASMVTASSSSATTLGKIGISIESNNHLSIDEDYFKNKADMGTAKSLFNGTGSYAYNVATRASMVKSYSGSSLSKLTGSSSYSDSGSYISSASDLLSSLNTTI